MDFMTALAISLFVSFVPIVIHHALMYSEEIMDGTFDIFEPSPEYANFAKATFYAYCFTLVLFIFGFLNLKSESKLSFWLLIIGGLGSSLVFYLFNRKNLPEIRVIKSKE